MYIHLSFFAAPEMLCFFTDILPATVKDWYGEKTSNALLPYWGKETP